MPSSLSLPNPECQSCINAFTRNSKLKNPSQTHTEENQFECYECGKGFTSHRGLATHRRIHHRVKPFDCQQCGKNTSWESTSGFKNTDIEEKYYSERLVDISKTCTCLCSRVSLSSVPTVAFYSPRDSFCLAMCRGTTRRW